MVVKLILRSILLSIFVIVGTADLFAQAKKQPERPKSPQLDSDQISDEELGVYKAFFRSHENPNAALWRGRDYLDPEGLSQVTCLAGIKFRAEGISTEQFTDEHGKILGVTLSPGSPHQSSQSPTDDLAGSVKPPPSRLRVSNVVFDRSRTHAVFSYDLHCGDLCAVHAFAIFKKSAKGWKQVYRGCDVVLS
jgi:hypothetical protein